MKTSNWIALFSQATDNFAAIEPMDAIVNKVSLNDNGADARIIADIEGRQSLAGKAGKLQITVSQKGKVTTTPQGGLAKELGMLLWPAPTLLVVGSPPQLSKPLPDPVQTASPDGQTSTKWPLGHYLVTDASCPNMQNVKSGPLSYHYRSCLITEQRINGGWVVTSPPNVKANNNLGEFLGIVAGVRWCLANPERAVNLVYCDNQAAVKWYNQRRIPVACNKKYTVSPGYELDKKADQATQAAVTEALAWMKANEEALKGLRVEWWQTPAWGESPADFGLK